MRWTEVRHDHFGERAELRRFPNGVPVRVAVVHDMASGQHSRSRGVFGDDGTGTGTDAGRDAYMVEQMGLFARDYTRDAEEAVQQAADLQQVAQRTFERHPRTLVGHHIIYTPRAQGRRRAVPTRALVAGYRASTGRHLLYLPDAPDTRRATREVRLRDANEVLSWMAVGGGGAGGWGREWPAGAPAAGARVVIWRRAHYTNRRDRTAYKLLVRAGGLPFDGRIPYEAYVVGARADGDGETLKLTLLVPFDCTYETDVGVRRATRVALNLTHMHALRIVTWGTEVESDDVLAADDALFDILESEQAN